jgi:hypothetical protein
MGIGISFIGRKVGEEIKKFVRLIFEAWKDDSRNALLYNPAGEDSVPLNDERIILVKVDGTGKYAAVGVLTLSRGAKPGEKILFARNPEGDIVSKLSMLHGGIVNLDQAVNFTVNFKKNASITVGGNQAIDIGGDKDESVKGNKTENAAGNMKYTAADFDIASTMPVGINDGLYETGLGPYLTKETAAATALQSASDSAASQLAALDALSGGAGAIASFGAAVSAFCAAMKAADSAAHTTISKAVK